MSKSRLATCLLELELALSPPGTDRQSRVILVERSRVKGITRITEAGRRLYEVIQHFFAQHDRLAATVRNEAIPEPTQVSIAVTESVLAHFLPGIFARYRRTFKKRAIVRTVVVEEADVPLAVKENRAQLGIGPVPPRGRVPRGIKVHELPLESPMCLLCPPSHPLALGFRSGQKTSVDVEELALLNLFILSPSKQDGLQWELPTPDARKGGGRINVASFETIIGFVRLGEGVGLVPKWPWALQNREQQGQIVPIPVNGLSPVTLALFLPNDEQTRPDHLREIIEAVESQVNHLRNQLTVRSGYRHTTLPAPVTQFTHGYYVSCTVTGCTKWRRCTVRWTKASRGDVRGTATDDDVTNSSPYVIEGKLDEKILQFQARQEDKGNDCYSAAFASMAESPKALVGTWTGFDDGGIPASGPFVLAQRALEHHELYDVTRIAQLRIFLNAEEMAADRPALPDHTSQNAQ